MRSKAPPDFAERLKQHVTAWATAAGQSDAVTAFRELTGHRGVREWDPTRVVSTIEAVGGAPEGWGDWMRAKYLLAPDTELEE